MLRAWRPPGWERDRSPSGRREAAHLFRGEVGGWGPVPLICLATPRKLPCLPQQLGLGYPLSGSVASGNSRRGAGRTPGGWAQAEREVREAAVERPGAEAPARSCRPRRQTQSWTGWLTEAVRGPIGGLHTCPRPPASDGGALSPGTVVRLAQAAAGQGRAQPPRDLRGVHPSVLGSVAPHTLACPAHPPGPSGPGASPQVAAGAEVCTGPRGPGGVPLGCAQAPAEGDKGPTQAPFHSTRAGLAPTTLALEGP